MEKLWKTAGYLLVLVASSALALVGLASCDERWPDRPPAVAHTRGMPPA